MNDETLLEVLRAMTKAMEQTNAINKKLFIVILAMIVAFVLVAAMYFYPNVINK